MGEERIIGYVVGGSMEKGVKVRLTAPTSEDVEVGGTYIAEGVRRRYMLIVNDIAHENEELASQLSAIRGAGRYLDILRGGALRSSFRAIVAAQLSDEPSIARTLPDYLSPVRLARKSDVEEFYGSVSKVGGEEIGVGIPTGVAEGLISPDLEQLVATSFAIYGKSGTGKTVLGNILATAIALKTLEREKGVDTEFPPTYMLILDMHSEYGTFVRDSRGGRLEDGFAGIIRNDVYLVTPDRDLLENLRKEFGERAAFLGVNVHNIEPEDLILMSPMLNLTDYQELALLTLPSKMRELGLTPWLPHIYRDDLFSVTERKFQNDSNMLRTLRSLHRKLRILSRMGFIVDQGEGSPDAIDEVIRTLTDPEQRLHVVIPFGRYGDDPFTYMLLTNMISRRLWMKAEEGLLRDLDRRIVIFVEEAHKFLDPQMRESSPLNKIARELRKRGIVLCLIDQRPSQIDPNVHSMVWNVFTSVLGDDRDVEAATTNLGNQRLFKPVIKTLDRKHFLAYGSAFRFPVVMDVIDYREFADRARRAYARLRVLSPGSDLHNWDEEL